MVPVLTIALVRLVFWLAQQKLSSWMFRTPHGWLPNKVIDVTRTDLKHKDRKSGIAILSKDRLWYARSLSLLFSGNFLCPKLDCFPRIIFRIRLIVESAVCNLKPMNQPSLALLNMNYNMHQTEFMQNASACVLQAYNIVRHLAKDMESTSKDDEAEKDKNKTDKNETTAEDNTNKNADDKNPCSTAGSDLDKNPKEAFSQFNIKPENAESKPETVNRRMSAEEVSKSYERLDVIIHISRCQFCKFTTDDEVIFKNHADMCLSKSLGGKRPEEKAPIDLKYDGSIFHCLNCSLHYSSKQEFEEHIVCHTTDNPYICLTCKQSFVSRKIIEQHTKTVHVAGNAKCGLRGIKRGRQIVDDLLKDGSKVIYGKLAIPKTIDNKSEKQSPSVPVQIQPKLLKPAVSSAPPTYMENYIIVKTSQENTTTCKIPASATVNSSAGAVTTTVASTRVYVPKKVDKEKEEAINSLFGIINPETKEIMATNVSTKIQKIVNPVTSTRSLLQPTSSQYKVQDITEYTSTPAVRLTSTTISTVAPSNGQFLLVPIGPSLVQTSAGPSALNTSTSIRPQMIVIGGQVPPSASAAAPPSVTSGRSLISGIPATTMSSFSKTNQPIMMQFIQSKPPTPIKLAKSFLPTVDLPLLQTTISPSLTQINPANATVVIATGSTSTTEQNQPITVPASKTHSVIIVPNSESQVNTSINPSLNMPGPRTDLEKFNVKPRLAPQPSTKKLLFRIKPGQGYVCEACKKFTKDELIFRKHLWEHFHGIPLACGSCTFQQLQSKDILNCKLVGNIVCSLVKRSTEDKRRSKPFKIVKNGEKEIIDITDDDNIKELTADLEQESKGNNGSTAEVIVLDDDDGDSGCLQIKICETYSLADQKILNIDKTLSDESNHAGSCVEKTDEDISSSKPKDESLRSKEKDLTKGSDKSEDVDDVDENRQTNTLSELQKIDENPNEEDAAPTNDLLNKSLSQSEAETECTVAKVIDSNLKLDDPKLLEKDKEIDFLIDQALLPVEPETNKESSLVGLKSSRISQSNKAVEEFDKQTLEQLGYNSFYACGYEPCGFTCLSSVKYREHLKDKKHQTEYCYLCSHCGQKDYKEDSHVRHLFSHSMSKTFLLYKCPLRLCKFKTNMIQFYEEHLKAHPKEELNIKCTYCHQMFPSIESLSQHLQKNLLKFITCPYCSFKFEKKPVVFQHIKHSHPDKIRMISVSGQIVCNEREINFYVVPKAKTNPDQERVNPKVIDRMLIDNSSANSLDIPRLLDEVQGERVDEIENNVDTNNGGSEIDDSEDAENESLPDLDQTQTESDTPNKKGIERLSDGAKNEPKQVHDSIGPKCLLCPKCKYLSYNQSYHIQHMSLHDKEPEREKRFLCYLCPKGLESLPNLKKHIQNHLGKHDINVYCCTVCSYMSNQKAHIMDHCEDGHEQKSMYTLKEETVESTNYYTCKYCDFVTRAVDQVSQHENVVHKVKPIVSMEPMQKVTETFKASFKEETMKEQKQSKKESEGGKKKYHCEYCSTFWKHKADLKKHMLLEHDDIENKQFTSYKCKYCNLTSTMKDLIVKHYDKMHTGLAIRILRKVEHIDIPSNEQNSLGISKQPDHEEDSEKSVEKIDVVIPDGTIFKTPFKCQNCDFMSNYRITTMRHLKEHPNMRPVRPNPCKKTPSKPTARKSTTIPNPFSSGKKTPHKNSLLQNGPNAGRFLLNPFAKVKEAVAETRGDPSSPSKDFYVLGENRLHSALTACFTAMVEDLRFQCRICTQKIAKKFVLHRHILDHLKIVFFKCRYCNEGTIERTLIAGHIQKEHSNMPLVYDTVSKQELEDLLEERTCNLDFNDKIDIQVDVKKGSTVPRDLGLKTEQVHEIADVKSDVENEITKEKPNSMTFVAASNSRKCPMCRYVAKKDNVLVSHIAAHDDPYKKFVCSGCDYRGDKYNVIKHIYRVVHSVPARIVEQQSGKKTTTNQRDDKSAEDTNSKKVLALPKPEKTPKKKADTASIHSEDSDCISNSKGKSVSIDSFTVSLHGVFEIKTKVKCKICGEKKESKSSMYGHFRSSPKCNGPYYQCSLCSFQSSTKIAIRKHAQIRHPKTKAIALTLPMAAKMKVIKIPIKQDNQVANMLKKRKAAETDLDSDFYNVDVDVDDSDDTKTEDSCNQIKSSSSEIACRLCQTYTCANVMKLQYHVNTFHQGTTVHCQKCSYKTPVLQHIFNHCKNVHHQNVPQYSDKKMELENIKRNDSDLLVTSPKVGTGKHECPKCNKRFVNAGSLKPHLFKHFNYSPYKCKLCKASFFRSDYIQKHFEAEHHGKEFIKQYVRNDAIEEKVNKIMKINRRPKNFDKFKVVEEGIRFHNGVWYCNECGKSSDFLKGIKSHLQIHSNTSRKRPFESERDVVQLKGKKTKLVNDPQILQEASSSDDAKDSSKSLIKFKIEVNGNGNKMYRCGYCNLSFNNKFKVKNHIAGVHQKMNKFKYKCCFCGYLSMFS
ncbi:REST-like protein [Mya arenaria]|uniref:REST-like protein n=1 Tax=Mya arenaria TaxID=6604 RepID=A0ABY7DUF9_MYAAR|nr:REST-like protein [Mya arenaria]